MFCPQCGAKADTRARYCVNCGSPLPAGKAQTLADEATSLGSEIVTSNGSINSGTLDSSGSPEVTTSGHDGGGTTPPRANVSAVGLFFQTLPYVFLRIIAYLAFALVLLVFLGLMGGVGLLTARFFQSAGLPLAVVGLIAFMGAWALAVLAQRYVLYLVRIAHVAVITEVVTKGRLPEGTNQVAYGKEKVLKHFGSASALFVVDQLVAGTVRQVLNWLSQAAGCLANIPGLGLIIGILRRILNLAATYIDEAVMSYILRREDENVYQAACDGVVLYAQSWRQLLGTATWCVLVVTCIWVVSFLLILFPLLGVAKGLTPEPGLQALYGFVGLLAAFVLANVIKWALIDPIATVGMVLAYNRAIEGQVPSYDLRATITSVSGRFRELVHKATSTPPRDSGPAVSG
ncbi:MAG: zinc ribbon domain-containing protein [Syntrophothermus sp.]|uniref:zinc ribbon domain-containing protein n=1 Tax=Syntrophothermus sp. TaxID=2736299 RepID=UPI00257FEB8A|nr:zinc ribbon domain-containing protein [Syntrophothermus sp.]NSW82028.1 zinc ribbon domain-containing protein [Syntrophothermus sp.]